MGKNIVAPILDGHQFQFIVGASRIPGSGVVIQSGGPVGGPGTSADFLIKHNLGDESIIGSTADVGQAATGFYRGATLNDGFFQGGGSPRAIPGGHGINGVSTRILDGIQGPLSPGRGSAEKVVEIVLGPITPGQEIQEVGGIEFQVIGDPKGRLVGGHAKGVFFRSRIRESKNFRGA